jgi:mannose-1-phosphate guanylyltransferase
MQPSDLRAMLVTAGFGTRLAPLTDLLPKPAVPLANRPTVWFALDHLRRLGLREFVLNTHHLARELEAEVRAVAAPDLRLSFVHEPEILGTGGGVRNAWQPQAGETFLIMNGKLLFAPDIAAALRLHRESGAIATMIVSAVASGDPLGAIEYDRAGRVRRLLGQPAQITSPLTAAMYTGVSLLDARAHRDLPERGCLIREAYRHWIDRGEQVMAFVDPGSFRDVGMSHWHYWEANMALLGGEVRWPGIAPDAEGALCASDVRLGDDARVRQSAVGSGAQIAPGVTVERCVIWPQARVERDLDSCVVLPDGRQLSIAAIARP